MSKIVHRFYNLYSGGGEVVVLNIVHAFPEHQHVLVFTNEQPTWLAAELRRTTGVSLIRTSAANATKVLIKESPDVLLFHYYPPMSRADLTSVPESLLGRSAVYNHWYTAVPFVPAIRRYCFPSPSSSHWSGAEIPARRKRTIINPVSERFFDVRRQQDATFRVGRHSRGTPGKFSPDFFDLFEQINVPDLQVLSLGHPPEMSAWLAARAFTLKQTYWLLASNTMEVARFLSFLDVYVYKTHANFRETSPLCILEALAAGIPVVAEARGGIVDLVVDGETGYLCDTLDDYRNAVEALYRDPALRHRYSDAGRAWARAHASLACFRRQIGDWLNLGSRRGSSP